MPMEKQRKLRSGLRGMARLCAVQAMYQYGVCNRNIGELIEDFSNNGHAFVSEDIPITEIDRDFFRQLLAAVGERMPEIDVIISNHLAEKWRMDRLNPVTLCILRLGIAELLCFREIPENVVFNEYIEIAKAFLDTKEAAFINGLLNQAALALRIVKTTEINAQ
jgi:N utilization substance protein B